MHGRWLTGLLLVASCGDGAPPPAAPPDFSGPAQITVESAGGHYSVEVRTSPSPPRKGVNWAEYRITDASGAPVTGLSLDVSPWMPAHGHGATVRPSITESGAGTYTIENLLFYMSGHWELHTTIDADFDDVADPSLDVD